MCKLRTRARVKPSLPYSHYSHNIIISRHTIYQVTIILMQHLNRIFFISSSSTCGISCSTSLVLIILNHILCLCFGSFNSRVCFAVKPEVKNFYIKLVKHAHEIYFLSSLGNITVLTFRSWHSNNNTNILINNSNNSNTNTTIVIQSNNCFTCLLHTLDDEKYSKCQTKINSRNQQKESAGRLSENQTAAVRLRQIRQRWYQICLRFPRVTIQ